MVPATVVGRWVGGRAPHPARAPHLVRSRLGVRLLRDVLYPLLDYDVAVRLARIVAPMGGHEIFELMARELDLQVLASGLEHVPAEGPVMLVSNHPTGLADGIAVHHALRRVRPDLWFLANADAMRVAPRLDEIIVPVEWTPTKRRHGKTREMLMATARVIKAGQALVIFPSGRLSYFSWRGLTERPWQPTVITLARKFGAPVVPMRIVARNSWLFYAFSQVSRELRDITLFHELLNKRNRLFQLEIGPPLDPSRIAGDPAEAVARLQRFVVGGMRHSRVLTPSPRRERPLRPVFAR